ncbi:MAG: class I SAM-dependent methyltransferase [Flavipsychrobacter sp.]
MQDSKSRFSNRVADYVRYRPGYPTDIIQFLQQQYGLATGILVADIGAGTGISAEMFLKTGYQVIAIEPNKEMREKAIELLQDYRGFEAVDGAAEQTGLDDNSIDAIVCGQAFHWFDALKAKKEFKRILKPGGLVVLIWNERRTGTMFEKEYDELIVKHARDYVKVDHRNISDEHIAAFFNPEPFELKVIENSQVFDYEGLEGRLLSSSYMPQRDDAGYAGMTKDLKELFERYQGNGKVTIYYDTKVYVGKLK